MGHLTVRVTRSGSCCHWRTILEANVKRGLTRIYMVLWACWLFYVVGFSLVFGAIGGWPIKLVNGVLIGLLLPWLLLVAIRWVAAGFVKNVAKDN